MSVKLKARDISPTLLRPYHLLVTPRSIEYAPAFGLVVLLPCLPASCADGTRVRPLEPQATQTTPQQLSVCEHGSAGEVMSTARRQGEASSCHRRRSGSSHAVGGAEQEKRVQKAPEPTKGGADGTGGTL